VARIALACCLAAAALWPLPATATGPRLKIVAGNLDNPRKLFVAPDGALYVVEAGTGGNVQGRGCRPPCVGTTGAIVRIRNGRRTPVVTGLGSFSVPTGQEAQGPAAAIVRGKTFAVLMQDMEIDSKGVNPVGLPNAGELFTTPAGKAAPKVIANLATFEAAHNPDHGAGPGPKYGQPPIDSDPYAFVPYRGGFAVVDAAANDLLWVGPSGTVSVLAVFPTRPVKLTRAERQHLGTYPSNVLPVQSVPTSVAVGPDGALYVGELTGWPYRPGTARIWRISPGKKISVYAGGLTDVSDIAFQGRNLLVLELAARGLQDPASPGALIRLSPNGTRTVLASAGLVAPSGLAVGNGSIYISNYGTSPGTGPGPHGEVVSVPASLGS
jgi:hypothetical protein